MAKRRYNYQLVKIHRNYTVGDLAELYGIHKNTVRNWVKDGLCPIDNNRPMLFVGHVLAEFIKSRRKKNKQTCKAGEIFCVGCRAPKSPAGNMVDYIPVAETLGKLQGICPDCDSMMNRSVNPAKIDEVCGNVVVTSMKG